jgi:iron complex outermembrane recepter protein
VRHRWKSGVVLVLAAAGRAAGAQDSVAAKLPPVVTVTRDVGRSPLDLPYGIASLRPDSLAPGQLHMNVDQTLSLLPGVTVANRTNPSQDTRISVRGFGARSQFGARSIRILRDGMPLTLPDGQTPIDYLDLESVERVEVIRGAAAALYGNAAGGVIDLRSAPPPDEPFAAQLRSWTGAYGMHRYAGLFGGESGPLAYEGNIGHTQSDGYRAFSQQRLTNAFIHSTAQFGKTQLGFTGMGIDEPVALNPGQLTRAQADSAPQQADAQSVLKQARKTVHQVQLGVSATRPVGAGGELTGQVYGGTRALYNPQTFAIVRVDRHQQGAGARLTLPWRIDSIENRFSVGADAQWLSDLRKNWANCNGVAAVSATCPVLPVEKGAISLDQRERVSSLGPYVRDEVELGRFRGSAGVRADQVTFDLTDHYFGDGRDDSGERTMGAVSPMLGAAWRLAPLHSLYASVGSAFETPTTTELGNHPDGSAGLNPDLKPQFSTTYETGAKGLALDRIQYDGSLFDTEVRDELIPFQIPNGNGRTYYENAGRTRRQGAELEVSGDVGPMTLTGSYAYSHFRFRDFVSGGVQLAGKSIPGIPEQQWQAAATWHLPRAFVVADVQSKSQVFVNDANQAAAPSFTVVDARIVGVAAFGKPWLSPVLGVQNLFDTKYIGSVAINATGTTLAATKFYEPSPRRTWFIGLSAATSPW